MARKPKRRKRTARPDLLESQILAWADAFHARTGRWPRSGPYLVSEQLGETWRRVDTALRYGLRGLPGRSSLARLLAKHRQVRNLMQLPPLSIRQILAWSDSYRERTGNWPTSHSGGIPEAPGETWRGVDQALRVGIRSLAKGSSLSQLLTEHRAYRNIRYLPRMTLQQILTWAEAHHRRTGTWPTTESGLIPEAPGETWSGVDAALKCGRRRLVSGSSLVRLLAERRGLRNPKRLPKLTLRQILAWARAHYHRTGRWPNAASGPIPESPGETWSAVQSALYGGYRGLPAGLTLARVVGSRREAPRKSKLQPLTMQKILAWADAHHRRTGCWPHRRSGLIAESPGETWRGIDQALRTNRRGLAGGMTLVRLLAERRGLRIRPYLPRLTRKEILGWARRHRQRTGAWPSHHSGSIADAPGETWRAVDEALRTGNRGLRGGLSLARLLARFARARNRTNLPQLTLERILAWVDDHRRRNGLWPTDESGPIAAARGETWKGVAMALRFGHRGLRGGLSLAQLLAQKRGVRNRASLPRLNSGEIVIWAEEHFQRTGTWPTGTSGPVTGSSGETWAGIEMALRYGLRGLPGASSLARLLKSRKK